MKLKFYKLFLSLCIFSFIGIQYLPAQVINNESFDNVTFLPGGWSSVGTTTLWSRRTTGTFPTCTPQNGAGMARFSSRAQVAGTNQTIATPIIDYSNRGSSQAYFSFWIYRDNGSVNTDSVSVYVNTSAGLTGAVCFGTVTRYSKLSMPDTVAINGWYHYSFNIPSTFNTNTNYIMIKGISQNGYNIYLDEVQWNSFPNLCTGKPNPGTATANPAVICGGSGSATISLSGNTSGVAGLTMQWKSSFSAGGPWNNVGTNSSTYATGNITSTQYYKCVISCSNSGLSDSTGIIPIVVKSNALPVITVSPNNASYCSGSTGVRLVASGASSYQWSPAIGLSSTNKDTVYASPGVTTLYTVKGSDTGGCVGQTTVNVTLRQSPNVIINTPDSTMCVGDSVQLTALSGGGGNTYLWTPTSKTTQAIFAKPLVSTAYSVLLTNTFGCKGTGVKQVLVSQKPKAGFELDIIGRTYNFRDSSRNAASVYWDFGDGNTSNSRNPVYTYSFDGARTITMIAFNPPCSSDTFRRSFNVSGITHKAFQGSFGLYPNPAEDFVQIEFMQDRVPTEIRILESSGKVLKLLETKGETKVIIQLSDFDKGLYLIDAGGVFRILCIE